MKKTITFLCMMLIGAYTYATEYWISPTGDDSKDGKSLENAWKSPNKAFQTITAGDILWVKGGTYTISASDLTVKAKNPGTQTNPVKVFAVRGEKPVFDCSAFRNYGSEDSKYRGMDLRQPWWHVRGIKIYKAGHNGIIVAGSNIVVEGCTVEECGHDGISIGSGAVDALILNCDSYRNAEVKGKGENGDGFAAKEGIGTVFRGCRAWENADDGWDVYGGSNPVLLDSCWSFANGTNYWQEQIPSYQGDGNGFKLGGGGGVTGNAPNVVLNSFAFNNVSKGFDQNHNAWGVTCINCTGYNNNGVGNFAFHEAPTQGKHVMINNLSYGGTGQNIASGSTETTNSWNLALSFTDDMFEALPSITDNSNAKYERDDDYKLTDPRLVALFTLKSNNPAIDKGTVQTNISLKPYYAIPYCGVAPDLGAREYVSGDWIFPDPDEENPGGIDPGDPENPGEPGDRPSGEKEVIVDVVSQFTVSKSGGTSVVWGPFALASAESAVFDMKAVGSSNGAVIIEFSTDNSNWVQVGAQAKNGSTSLVKGKTIDLSADDAPWGPKIYIRFSNKTDRDVQIENLKITGTLYDPNLVTSIDEVEDSENAQIMTIEYYNLNGLKVKPDATGILIKKTIYVDGKCSVEKLIK